MCQLLSAKQCMCADNHASVKRCMIIRRKDKEKNNIIANCSSKKDDLVLFLYKNECIIEQFSRV